MQEADDFGDDEDETSPDDHVSPRNEPASPDRRRLLIALGFGAASAVTLSRLGDGGVKTSALPPSATGERIGPIRDVRPPQPPPSLASAAPPPDASHVFDQVITGGRVIDPDTGYDNVADVGIDGGTIVAISESPLQGRASIDATSRVVVPGFIDMISYAPNDYGVWFKIGDGVTTNLGMHGMLVTAADFFAQYERLGSPCHYGGAYDDQFMRSQGMLRLGADRAASSSQIQRLVSECEQQLHDGWIGVAFSPEYTPGITGEEIDALAAVAAKYGVPCFYHGRYSTDVPPDDNAKTLDEIVGVSRRTGSASHIMHITSTGGTFQMPQALATIDAARAEGLDVTACMYPYTFWATYLGSARFNDGWQERFHISYADLAIPGTGERLTKSTFDQYRTENKLAAAYAIPERDVIVGLQSPITMIGSDAILEPGDNNHPRAAGCFSRTLGYYVREHNTLGLVDALKKMTIMPARRLETKAPALAKKGRLQQGADADVVVFDPATVLDQSTVDDPAQASVGVDWVLVLGQVVKSPHGLNKGVKPGAPIRSAL